MADIKKGTDVNLGSREFKIRVTKPGHVHCCIQFIRDNLRFIVYKLMFNTIPGRRTFSVNRTPIFNSPCNRVQTSASNKINILRDDPELKSGGQKTQVFL